MYLEFIPIASSKFFLASLKFPKVIYIFPKPNISIKNNINIIKKTSNTVSKFKNISLNNFKILCEYIYYFITFIFIMSNMRNFNFLNLR